MCGNLFYSLKVKNILLFALIPNQSYVSRIKYTFHSINIHYRSHIFIFIIIGENLFSVTCFFIHRANPVDAQKKKKTEREGKCKWK